MSTNLCHESAKTILLRAQEVARTRGASTVKPIHVLAVLASRAGNGLVVSILNEHGITLRSTEPTGIARTPDSNAPPVEAATFDLFDAANEEAAAAGQLVCPEHVLAALLKCGDPEVTSLFAQHSVTPEKMCDELKTRCCSAC